MVTKNEALLPVSEVVRRLRYDPETGNLYWRVKVSHTGDKRGKPGSIAGTATACGYVQVTINKKTYRSHRIAFAIMEGRWPEHQIDHINRVRGDNRWCNLREATSAQQQGNRAHTVTGAYQERGVTFIKKDKSWQAAIAKKYLGRFKTKAEAKAAFDKAARERYGEFYIKWQTQ